VAKSKTTNAVKSATTVPVKRKPPAANNKPAAVAKPAPGPAPTITSAEIGRVAGDIWGLLVRDGGLSLAAIKKSVKAPPDVVAAAIGWLAREDKLVFSMNGKQLKVSLR